MKVNKFIVNGLPRTGSTAIRTAIQYHTEVYCLHECLHDNVNARDPWGSTFTAKRHKFLKLFQATPNGHSPLTKRQILRQLAYVTQRRPNKDSHTHGKQHVTNVGLHYNSGPGTNPLAHDLVTNWVDKIIAIDRPNQFDRWKSWYKAMRTKIWHEWKDSDVPYKDSIAEINKIVLSESDFKRCEEYIITNTKRRDEWLEWVKSQDSYIVDYDTFCETPGLVLNEVQEFLGVDRENITPNTKKFKKTSFKNEDALKEYLVSKNLIK